MCLFKGKNGYVSIVKLNMHVKHFNYDDSDWESDNEDDYSPEIPQQKDKKLEDQNENKVNQPSSIFQKKNKQLEDKKENTLQQPINITK